MNHAVASEELEDEAFAPKKPALSFWNFMPILVPGPRRGTFFLQVSYHRRC